LGPGTGNGSLVGTGAQRSGGIGTNAQLGTRTIIPAIVGTASGGQATDQDVVAMGLAAGGSIGR
jgi:hypothetical protein